MTKRALQVKEARRKRLAVYRKAALTQSSHVYRDLARLGDVTYSMADKWMNARRASKDLERAFHSLTGQPAFPPAEAA